jgi:S-adenosylmethionine hydrolase
MDTIRLVLKSDPMKNPIIALMTDFSTKDPYIGIMKDAISSIAPSVQLIDSHPDL